MDAEGGEGANVSIPHPTVDEVPQAKTLPSLLLELSAVHEELDAQLHGVTQAADGRLHALMSSAGSASLSQEDII
ncbi:unnamed protein product, partial [Chrysoparadoxa australica]